MNRPFSVSNCPVQAEVTVSHSEGKRVWNRELTPDEKKLSRKKHHEFHRLLEILSDYLIAEGGFGIVFDVHSFNYRREEEPAALGEKKPDINLGTKAANREAFGGIIEYFLDRLGEIRVRNKTLRAAENEIFPGGYLTRTLSQKYGPRILVPAVEFKKIFMDERTGEFYPDIRGEVDGGFRRAVEETVARAEALYRGPR